MSDYDDKDGGPDEQDESELDYLARRATEVDHSTTKQDLGNIIEDLGNIARGAEGEDLERVKNILDILKGRAWKADSGQQRQIEDLIKELDPAPQGGGTPSNNGDGGPQNG